MTARNLTHRSELSQEFRLPGGRIARRRPGDWPEIIFPHGRREHGRRDVSCRNDQVNWYGKAIQSQHADRRLVFAQKILGKLMLISAGLAMASIASKKTTNERDLRHCGECMGELADAINSQDSSRAFWIADSVWPVAKRLVFEFIQAAK